MKADNLTLLACLSLTLGGCFVTADNDDDVGDDAGFDTDDPSADDSEGDTEPDEGDTEGDGDTDTDGGSDTDGDGSTGGDTDGGEELECSDNIMADPGFESGTPSEMWEEASELFGTPLCDESCTTDEGAEPRSGSWWIWFGGSEEPEQASMSQTVTLDAENATLSFWFSINSAAGTGDDVFTVKVDEEAVFTATDGDLEQYDGYTLVEIDVSRFADGAEHVLAFEADLTGEGLTNFFLDDVELVECEPIAAAEDSGGETDGETDGDTDA
jgi:hypothetical protein